MNGSKTSSALSAEGAASQATAAMPALDWLIQPISPEQFFARYWEKQPLLVQRSQPDYFRALFSLDEADRVLTTLDRRYPDIILKNASRDLTPDDYTTDGEVLEVARVFQLFAEGATITLAYLDTVVPALTQFCRSLEARFSCPCQTNIYLTPPRAQGAKTHYDTHDVFVLQVAGSKQWRIYETPVELPLPGQEFDAAIHPPGPVTMEFELRAGDVAYVPRGVMHDARSTDEVSLHITTGVLRYTWADLLHELVAGASLKDPALRRALPPGFARSDFAREPARSMLREVWQRAWAGFDFDAALDHFVDQFLAACPPPLRGQMAQIDGLDRLTPSHLAGARPGVMARLTVGAEAAAVECGGRRITFPPQAGAALRFALEQDRFAIRDLPGHLDEAGKLTLVRRLIREGLVVALPQ